jgi:hypothetical protein
MSKSVLKITTHLPAIPSWLKINNMITIPLSLKNVKELAAKLNEVKDDMEIEILIETGKEASVGIKYELKKDVE